MSLKNLYFLILIKDSYYGPNLKRVDFLVDARNIWL